MSTIEDINGINRQEFSNQKIDSKNIFLTVQSENITFRYNNNTIKKYNIKNSIKSEINDNILNKKKNVSIFKLYFHLSRPIDYLFIIFALIGCIGSGISIIAQVYIFSDIFSEVGNTSESNSPDKINNMILIVEKYYDYQIKNLLIFGVASFVCNFLSVTFWNLVGQRNMHNFRFKYFSLLLAQEQQWFDQNNPFKFATKIQNQLDLIEQGIGEKLGNIFSNITQCLSGFIIAFITSWKLSLVILSVFPFILINLYIMQIFINKKALKSRKVYEEAGGIAEEILYNIKIISSFANFEFELKRYNEKIEEYYKIEIKKIYKLGIFIGLSIFFIYAAIFISLFYGRSLIENEYNSNKKRKFTGGDVVNVSFCTLIGVIGLSMIFPNIKIIQEACSACSDYFILCERKIPFDFNDSIEEPNKSLIRGTIIFKNVKFKYSSDEKGKLILDNLNLLFETGKKIALVGESGCGKSTIVNLIARLYEVNNGKIFIDNLDIKKYNVEYLRSLIGYVEQEPVLFNRSIKENIIFGREKYFENNEKLEQYIKEACDESFASEFINNLPGKLDYVVGIKGNKLSGGQRQRIAIARAILIKPKILILDEATSSLDYKSEKEVQKSLDNICKRKVTTIIISHRLSTIINADLIYFIKEGKVLEKGTHQELLTQNGYYAELIKAQLIKDEIIKKNNESIKEKDCDMNISNIDKNNNNHNHQSIFISQNEIKFEIKRILKELKEKKLNIILAFIGGALVGGINPIIGAMIGQAINGLNSQDKNIRKEKVTKYGLIFIFISFLQGCGNILMNWQFMILGAHLTKKYRKKIFEKYLKFHLSFFDLEINSPGALLTRLSIDTTQLNSLIIAIFGGSIISISVFVVGFISGCIYEYRLTLILFGFIPFIILSMIFRRKLNKNNSPKGIKAKIEAGGILSECVTSTKTIFSYNFQKKAVEIYMEIINYLKKKILFDSLIGGFFIGLGQFCIFAAQAAVLTAAKKFIMKRQINSEDVDLVLSIILSMATGIGQGMGNFGDFKKAKTAFKSLYSILDSESRISAFKLDNKEKKSPEKIKGKIEFKHVYFSYPTNPEKVVLNDINFIIEPEQHVAFVGYSGSGKSTIFQLLQRFYDIEDGKGEILVDDINIKEYNLYELRKKIGWVNQDPVLFKRSMKENIRYGNLDANDEQCENSAKDANIINIFEKGHKDDNPISGGEKQRIAIARVFLKNPVILLMDEATSSLDKNNEIEIQKSLDKLANKKTSITIAHRLNTIENSDMIFVLEGGEIVEKGKHQDLMELKKVYYNLYQNSQN